MVTTSRVVVLLALSPLIVLAVHSGLSRMMSKRPPLSAAIAAVFISLAPVLLLIWDRVLRGSGLKGTEQLLVLGYCLAVYLALQFAYLNFFNMSETARRIRLLHEVKERGEVEEAALRAAYNENEIIDRRLERLAALGELSLSGGLYRARGGPLYRCLWIFSLWRRMLGLR